MRRKREPGDREKPVPAWLYFLSGEGKAAFLCIPSPRCPGKSPSSHPADQDKGTV